MILLNMPGGFIYEVSVLCHYEEGALIWEVALLSPLMSFWDIDRRFKSVDLNMAMLELSSAVEKQISDACDF